jgi:hypothetical protein
MRGLAVGVGAVLGRVGARGDFDEEGFGVSEDGAFLIEDGGLGPVFAAFVVGDAAFEA